MTIKITSIFQDEPVLRHGIGSGNTCPDGKGVGTAFAQVRAERDGNIKGNSSKSGPGDGRVYHINFTATDTAGDSCSGQVTVCVPHDQSNRIKGNWGQGGGGGGRKPHPPRGTCVDEGPLFDSTVCPNNQQDPLGQTPLK